MTDETSTQIAVIGMSARLPGAEDITRFWENLREGVDGLTRFSREELLAAGVPEEVADDPRYVPVNGRLADVDRFDAAFFGLSPREAEVMDPQQRLFLECAWGALEHAGYVPRTFPGAIGVFAGAGMSSYLLSNLLGSPETIERLGSQAVLHANDKDFLATRTSYKLGLTGPSVVVQTACSTSLVAVHLAVQSLLARESDLALAGGVSISVPQDSGYFFEPGAIVSPDGFCRPFDAGAKGTVFGSGVGIVVLKRLEEAIEDRDTIYAVIRGTAVNNDGDDKVGFTAPSVAGQAAVISEAMSVAGVQARTIQYVEAHGTATELGDPIEVAALTQAFAAETFDHRFCGIGSVKSSVGHLNTAAGVTGLIKTVLALYHGELPASLHFTRPNPQLKLDTSPFYVNAAHRSWPAAGVPRRAGVSSFGVGGTNAHAILEEAPAVEQPPEGGGRRTELILLSAKSEAALARQAERLATYCRAHPDTALRDIARTLIEGRERFDHRRALVCRSVPELADVLRSPAGGARGAERRGAVFAFPGQGTQYAGMAARLYEQEPVFRRVLDECASVLTGLLPGDLRDMIFGESDELDQTARTQPVLFAVEYALAQLLISWGVRPEAMIGHSLGEYVAACVAGVMSLPDALALVAARGRLMQALPPGGMLAVACSEEELMLLLRPGVEPAAVNGPRACVVAGPPEAVEALLADLTGRGIAARRLRTSHAFHSVMMEPVLEEFRVLVRSVRLAPPALPYISNVTGTWITAGEATNPDYWVRQLRQTVRFWSGARLLAQDPSRVYLEVGPGESLSRAFTPQDAVFTTLRHDRPEEVAYLREQIGQAWAAGLEADWGGVVDPDARRIALPTYPFERTRFWVDPAKPAAATRLDPEGFHRVRWDEAPPAPVSGASATWLVFADDGGTADELRSRLLASGQRVVLVRPGERFTATEGFHTVRPARRADYEALLDAVAPDGQDLIRVVHLWNLGPPEGFTARQERGYLSLTALAQALGPRPVGAASVVVVSDRLFDLRPGDVVEPEKATILGPCLTMPQEFPQLSATALDVPAGDPLAVAGHVLAEAAATEPVVAYRDGRRLVRRVEHLPPPAPATVRTGGTYLIVGPGQVGLALAGHLARTARANVVLVGRMTLSEEAGAGPDEAAGRRIEALRDIERAGGQALYLTADVSDAEQMRACAQAAIDRFGALHGVIHAAKVERERMYAFLPEENAGTSAAHLAAKAHGLRALDEALEGHDLDFRVVFSSLTSLLGALGETAYTASNAFVDAFVAANPSWTGINCDRWDDERGVALFMRALAAGPGSLAESDEDLAERMRRARELTGAKAPAPTARPAGRVAYRAPGTPVEAAVAGMWRDLLGVDQVGADDDFFELGGHSLLAVQLVGRLRETYQVTLPLRDLLERRTVAGVAAAVAATQAGEAAPVQPVPEARTRPAVPAVRPRKAVDRTGMRFSVSFFAADDSGGEDMYGDLLKAAEYADRNGFDAVWLPERHFHRFGGRYPSPSVLAAALAVRTRNIAIRAGSVVLPLNHPVRVVEEWSIVDNLSGGRIGLSVASGWQRDDFVLAAPGTYGIRKELMMERLETVRRLWAGDVVTLPRDDGQPTEVRVFPKPRQAELPVWLTSSGSPETWTAAGARGLNVLTALISQSVEDLAENIRRYRAARAEHGHDPGGGQVTLSLHAFIGKDLDEARDTVRGPLQSYLSSHLELYRSMAESQGIRLAGDDRQALLDFAFERYFSTSALMGTIETASAMVERLRAIGVDEIACQLDFGVDEPAMWAGLERLAQLKNREAPSPRLQAGGARRSPVVTLQPEGGRPPFFCVHPVDGGVFGLRELAAHLGKDRPFHALQAPGLDGESAPATDLGELAAVYAEAMREVRPDGPYVLGGWSFGGVVATEVARLLTAEGHRVPEVIMLDSRAPWQMSIQLTGLTDLLDRWEPYLNVLPQALALAGDGAAAAAGRLGIPPGLLAELPELGERSIHAILLADPHARAVCRAHIDAMRRHRPQPLTVPVVLVRAADQPDIFGNDPLMGWGELAAAGMSTHVIPGDHFAMLRAPYVSELAGWLRERLG
ncbi:MupA/Atu3671 family FMN-dependent luciferase-like monooxygenase [Nonomuraea sp. NPDC004186]